MKLLTRITSRSMFRRAAWMKWLPPIPTRSPSPEKTVTSSSGRPRFSPVAEGMAAAVARVEAVQLHVAGPPPGAADAGDDPRLVEVDGRLLQGLRVALDHGADPAGRAPDVGHPVHADVGRDRVLLGPDRDASRNHA